MKERENIIKKVEEELKNRVIRSSRILDDDIENKIRTAFLNEEKKEAIRARVAAMKRQAVQGAFREELMAQSQHAQPRHLRAQRGVYLPDAGKARVHALNAPLLLGAVCIPPCGEVFPRPREYGPV